MAALIHVHFVHSVIPEGLFDSHNYKSQSILGSALGSFAHLCFQAPEGKGDGIEAACFPLGELCLAAGQDAVRPRSVHKHSAFPC